MGYGWISFLTDYGRRDGFVAACHGVIACIAPGVRVIDISHEVSPQDLRQAAAVLAQTVSYLPPAVHLAVVDPGVGTSRRPIAVQAGSGVLVGPDNGLLDWAAAALGGMISVVELRDPQFRLATGARTFDGRDVFAPAAAHIAGGVPLAEFGPAVDPDELVRLPKPLVRVEPARLVAEVLTIDHFGNVQLAARGGDLSAAGLEGGGTQVRVRAGGSSYDISIVSAFGQVGVGELLLYVDGAGHVAMAVNRGSAADRLGLRVGDAVEMACP